MLLFLPLWVVFILLLGFFGVFFFPFSTRNVTSKKRVTSEV